MSPLCPWLLVCLFLPPSLSTLSHPLHSLTGGRVPRAPPCMWTASGLCAHPPCCLPVAYSVRATRARTLAHSHSRTLAHTHSRSLAHSHSCFSCSSWPTFFVVFAVSNGPSGRWRSAPSSPPAAGQPPAQP
eukprot:scaffold3222_cov68-Phaeocystis_antarctica.AAC.1